MYAMQQQQQQPGGGGQVMDPAQMQRYQAAAAAARQKQQQQMQMQHMQPMNQQMLEQLRSVNTPNNVVIEIKKIRLLAKILCLCELSLYDWRLCHIQS